MKLNKYLLNICDSYRRIMNTDGEVTKDELIEMLKRDDSIPDVYKNDSGFELMAKNIFIKTPNQIKDERRMKLYNQGLSKEEIAKKEGVHVSSIQYWLEKKGLVDKKTPAVTGKCKKCKYYAYYIEHNEKNQGGKHEKIR